MENEDRLTIGDYLTLPIVDLVQDPDFDIGTFSLVAQLAKYVPSDHQDIPNLLTFIRNGLHHSDIYNEGDELRSSRMAEAIDSRFARVRSAWFDEGVNPAHHRRMRDYVRSEWPVLASALDGLFFR